MEEDNEANKQKKQNKTNMKREQLSLSVTMKTLEESK
jgi:hypothetical protein